jgi:aquaporin NIP
MRLPDRPTKIDRMPSPSIVESAEPPPAPLGRRLAAEAFGTFCLIFAGTGAMVVDEVTGGGVSHVGVGLTFGLVVLAMIQSLGDVSGCHINPAVTIGFWAAGRFARGLVAPYVASQVAGAVAASLVLRGLFPTSTRLGATIPAGPAMQSFWLEVLLTLMLMVVILGVCVGSRERGLLAGITIGGVIALEAIFAGPICGASMNPARSLAPAVVSARPDHLWVYLVGPVLGALCGVAVWRTIHAPAARPAEPAD